MTVGHLVFALHVGLMLARRGEARRGPTLLRRLTPSMTPAVTVANARAGA
jgi:hypothetical protein